MGSLKETQSQGTKHFIMGNPHGGENPTKTSLPIQCQDLRQNHQEKTRTEHTPLFSFLQLQLPSKYAH